MYGRLPDDYHLASSEDQELARKRVSVERERLYATLDALEIGCLGQGGAKGADELARDWARIRNVWLITYPADWDRHGKAAGPIRNEHMLREFEPDLVVAFPGGRGTQHMVSIALSAGVRVMMVGAA